MEASMVTLHEMVKPYFDRQEPLVLRQLLQTTPKNKKALQNFQQWDYWQETVDSNTTCQVELGGNYAKSQTADISFVDFLSYLRFFEEKYGRSSNSTDDSSLEVDPQELIYLAQNDAFPELVDQIEIPAFCETVGEGKLYSTMVWIGPYHCVSPLHQDPLDNVLMQFVGSKKVCLCPPDSNVRAGSEGNQKNTSPLDPEQLSDDDDDDDDLQFQQATLYPGDAMYIPKKWYHHVRTVETSVSINTWFR